MKINIAGIALIGLFQTAQTVVPRLAAAQIVQEGAGAEGTPIRRITLDEALGLLSSNLKLRIAHLAAAEAEALARQSSAYPNPAFTASHETLNATGPHQSESYITLSQRVEWPGARSARRTAARERAAVAGLRVAADSAMLAFRVKSAYVRAARSERQAYTRERVVEVFRRADESMVARYEEGDVSLYDLRRIGVERVRYEASLVDALLELDETRRELAFLVAPESSDLRLAPAEPLVGLPPLTGREDLSALALSRRPEVAASEAEVRSREAQLRGLRALRVPELTASGGFKRQSDGLRGLFVGMSVPLPLWNRSSGLIQAAGEWVTAEETRLALTQREVEDDVRRALAEYRSQRRHAALLTDASGGGQADLLSIAQVAYDTGEMELVGLLDAAEALSAAEIAVERIQSELWISYYDLERAIGGFGDLVRQAEGEE